MTKSWINDVVFVREVALVERRHECNQRVNYRSCQCDQPNARQYQAGKRWSELRLAIDKMNNETCVWYLVMSDESENRLKEPVRWNLICSESRLLTNRLFVT